MDFGDEMRQHTVWWWNGGTGGSEDGLWRGDETTHFLVAERRHRRVSRMGFGEETRRRTNWWPKGGVGGSAGSTLVRRQDNALPGGRTAAWEGQQDGLW